LPVFFSNPLKPDISSIRSRLINFQFARLSLGCFWITNKSHMTISADFKCTFENTSVCT